MSTPTTPALTRPASPSPAVPWPLPDSTKRAHLLALFRERGHRVLVESGTYRGATVEHFLPYAERIVSVEIEPALHAEAAARFAPLPSVEILLGDATELLPPVVAGLDSPPLVWLDGHFSGDVTGRGDEDEPAVTILARLASVAPAGTTIAVDDLRLFGADPAWPLLEQLVGAARDAFPGAAIAAAYDALVIRS